MEVIRNNLLEHPQSARALFAESSYGKLNFEGEVLGPVVVPRPAFCDPWGLGETVDAALIASGVPLEEFTHVLYSIPLQWPGCFWSGIAALPGSRSWVRGCLSGMMSHELGHNFGMNHASLTAADGSHVEYGDLSDTMGAATPAKTHNLPHKVQMGWVDPPAITDISSSQTVRLAPTGTPPQEAVSGGRAIGARIPLPGPLGLTDSYWLSYRTHDGLDASLPSSYANRLNIHLHPGPGPQQFQNTRFIAALAAGESFSAAGGAVRIWVLSTEASELRVQVQLSCKHSSPVLSLFPPTGLVSPVSPFDTALLVTNSEGLGCATSSYRLNGTFPPDLAISGLPSTLALAPGESRSIPLRVTAPAPARAGRRSFSISVQSRSGPVPLAVKTEGQVLLDTRAPAPPDALQARALPGGQVELSWRAAIDDGSGVALYQVRNLAVPIAQTSSTKVLLTPVGKSALYLSVIAIDRAGNISEQSSTVRIQPIANPYGSAGQP
jgi:hypothetical protein